MLIYILYIIIIFIILFVLMLAIVALSESNTIYSREELTPYECGFEVNSLSRVPLSLRYFFLTVIFLVFDIEIVLLMFVPDSLQLSSLFHTNYVLILLFILILLLGLIYEWNDGCLDWIM